MTAANSPVQMNAAPGWRLAKSIHETNPATAMQEKVNIRFHLLTFSHLHAMTSTVNSAAITMPAAS